MKILREMREARKPEPQKRPLFPAGAQAPNKKRFKGDETTTALGPSDDFAVMDYVWPPPPENPRSDEFFDDEFEGFYSFVVAFVTHHWASFEIKPSEDTLESPWATSKTTPLFRSMVELVEDVDPDAFGWDFLLFDSKKRLRMIVGIISRVLKDKVFDSLLFGCTKAQHQMLEGLELSLAENSTLDGTAFALNIKSHSSNTF